MSELKGACIIGQSGGPTSVINSSAAGAIDAALKSGAITRVLAAEHGIEGVLKDRLFDCGMEDKRTLELLKNTPSSALGSCRYKLKDCDEDDTDYKRILEIFKKYNVRYFFYNGGNDSMDTCNKVSKYMQRVGYECRIMGIPKTVDNDLAGTDHCPGFGSAAKFVATATAEISRDNKVYGKGSVLILEMMGRNAGWLTAASALANRIGEGPDLVYLPEVVFDMDAFIARIEEVAAKKSSVIVAVSEGVKDKDGRYVSEYGSDLASQKDAFGHAQMGGLASTLANIVKQRTGLKTRGVEFSVLQRCASHIASRTDIEEAFLAGATAVNSAVAGETDKMVGFKRGEGASYSCECVLLPLSTVANAEKTVPLDWLNETRDNMNERFFDYALPLIQGDANAPTVDGLPEFANLKKVFAE